MASDILVRLQVLANPRDAKFLQRFFKTGSGEYGEGDVFLGIRAPQMKKTVREFRDQVSRAEIAVLLDSEIHEARVFALSMLVDIFDRDETARKEIFDFYISHTARINNWDLVDLSAAPIVGGWLFDRDRKLLYRLVKSKSVWERRIAVIATYRFIRKNDFSETLKLAELLLRDEHDLMHKATGWMLREIGKRDVKTLETFLGKHAARMPRTMLRYAIEKFPEPRRQQYLRAGRP